MRKVKSLEEFRVKILPDQVSFDQYETVVLLDGYLNISTPGETRAHTARLVSAKLKCLAENRGRVINEVYRSEGGISGRLNRMDQAFRGEYSDDEPVPQVFKDTVRLYRDDRKKFKELLKTANSLIGKVVLPEDEAKAAKQRQKILHRLDLKKICVSTGSACDSQKTQISHVLRAMGLDEDYALGTIRVSFGRGNTMEDAAAVGDAIVSILRR